MSPDLAAPQGLRDLVEAFAGTARAVLDLAHSCSDDDLLRPTDCPGWTVHDQISHVVGVEAWLAGHRDPRVQMPPYEHLRNDLGKKVEYAVEVRRGRSGAEVADELEGVLAERLSALRDPTLSDTAIIAGPFGPDQATTVLLLRTFDVWTHEQDIRAAVGRPGNLDSPAAALYMRTVLLQLPRLIARGAGLEPGQAVVLDVSGPIAARAGFLVELDEQGRARGHTRAPGRLDPQVTISLSTEAFTRRAAGRRSVSDTQFDAVGDQAVARRVLEAMVVTH